MDEEAIERLNLMKFAKEFMAMTDRQKEDYVSMVFMPYTEGVDPRPHP